MGSVQIIVDIYKCNVVIIHGNKEFFNKNIKNYCTEEDANGMTYNIQEADLGRTWDIDNGPIVIWVKDSSTALSTFVHEIIHAVNMIFSYVGAKIDSENDELEAYLVEYIFEQGKTLFNA